MKVAGRLRIILFQCRRGSISPIIWQVDNESALAGFPGHPFTQPIRLALLLGVEVRFIPPGEPGRNADIESFNALWQERILRRFETPSLGRLAKVSLRFERWFMDERPHPKLSMADHGTRSANVRTQLAM